MSLSFFYIDEKAVAIRKMILSGQVNYWITTKGRLFEEKFVA